MQLLYSLPKEKVNPVYRSDTKQSLLFELSAFNVTVIEPAKRFIDKDKRVINRLSLKEVDQNTSVSSTEVKKEILAAIGEEPEEVKGDSNSHESKVQTNLATISRLDASVRDEIDENKTEEIDSDFVERAVKFLQNKSLNKDVTSTEKLVEIRS